MGSVGSSQQILPLETLLWQSLTFHFMLRNCAAVSLYSRSEGFSVLSVDELPAIDAPETGYPDIGDRLIAPSEREQLW